MEGLVVKSTGSWYKVRTNTGDIVECRIKGKFRIKGLKVTNPVAVGDRVELELESESEGVIHQIHDRKNYIIRKSVNLSKQYHILAANVDQAILLVTIDFPFTSYEFIDRFLVSAEAYGIPAIIVINKLDLYNDKHLEKLADLAYIYEEAGYKVLPISAKKQIGMQDFEALLKNKTTVVNGHSGVGKSTLLNTVAPEFSLKTSEISDAHDQGKHTTTFAEMFELPFGGRIIDTPGIRGLGVVDIEKEELANFFPEFLALKNQCKFHNCVHINEPNCGIKTALEAGTIAPERYNSYLSIYSGEDKEQYR